MAEADGHQLRKGAVAEAMRSFEVIFRLGFSPNELAWIYDASIEDFRKDPQAYMRGLSHIGQLVAKIETPTHVGPSLNEEYRISNAIWLYCALKTDDDPNAARLMKIINQHDPVLAEDCAKQAVVRQSDMDARISTVNFVAFLGGHAPLQKKETNDWPATYAELIRDGDKGALNYLSPVWIKFSYWWSQMPAKIRHETAAKVRQNVTKREDVFAYIDILLKQASHQTLKLATCNTTRRMARNTALTLNAQTTNIADLFRLPAMSTLPGVFWGVEVAQGPLAMIVASACNKVWK